MAPEHRLPDAARRGLRRPLAATRTGLAAERAVRAFWPLWTLILLILAVLMLGLQEAAPLELTWAVGVAAIGAALWFLYRGLRAFRWPSAAEALDRLDRSLPGRPITALSDTQAVGTTDAASRAIWEAHVVRMAERIRTARAVRPDLRVASRDPYALRYAALLAFAIAVIFGSVLRVGSIGEIALGGGPVVAAGPAWEGWIEPPAYTGRPSLYLSDLGSNVQAIEGSTVTIRLYGEVGDLTVAETVSARTGEPGSASDPAQRFEVQQDGRIEIEGPGGQEWDVAVLPDAPPAVVVEAAPERAETGGFRLPFGAGDDHGVVSGRAAIDLDLDAVAREYGLATVPDPREPIVLDLPLPMGGDRHDFTATLIDDFSQHPWANLPVTIKLEVSDAIGQRGASETLRAELLGRRFFDPMAQAVIEQRRDLLWSRDNARRVAQVLRAVSWRPEDAFRSHTLYLRLRVAIRRLEAGLDGITVDAERQSEIAAALWDIAIELEDGDLADARDRLRRAQGRLSEAMENGADDAEIAELMQELREAMDDYMRQLAEQSQGQEQQQAQGDMQEVSPNQLQEMMDRIQELMEEGRMAEAQALLDQLSRMMENMQVAQGQGGQPSIGQEAMEGLQETLRDQQELSDEAFRDLQEQFGMNQQGQQPSPGQSGEGRQGQGQQGQQGQGQQPGGGRQQPGEGGEQLGGGEGQSLADRQQALREELNRQRGNLPGAGTAEGDAAREALDDADRAMDGAEEALRDRDYGEALDRQADAMEALREGLRRLDEAMAEEQGQAPGQAGRAGAPDAGARDPLGREPGSNGRDFGSDQQFLGEEEIQRRAEELLDEIRRRSGDQTRPEEELDYLRRLLDRF